MADDGWTAMHYAAHEGYMEIVKLLIDKGACVEFAYCAGGWYVLSSDGLKMS